MKNCNPKIRQLSKLQIKILKFERDVIITYNLVCILQNLPKIHYQPRMEIYRFQSSGTMSTQGQY